MNGINRKKWTENEVERLIRAYPVLTIKELEMLFPDKNRNSINSKVQQLKRQNAIKKSKDKKTVQVARNQRTWSRQISPGEFNRDPDSWK